MRRIDLICLSFKSCKYTGCEILKIYSLAIDCCGTCGASILHSLELLQQASFKMSNAMAKNTKALEEIKMNISKSFNPTFDYETKDFQNKTKYIRQQHKLAQRHFKRK